MTQQLTKTKWPSRKNNYISTARDYIRYQPDYKASGPLVIQYQGLCWTGVEELPENWASDRNWKPVGKIMEHEELLKVICSRFPASQAVILEVWTAPPITAIEAAAYHSLAEFITGAGPWLDTEYVIKGPGGYYANGERYTSTVADSAGYTRGQVLSLLRTGVEKTTLVIQLKTCHINPEIPLSTELEEMIRFRPTDPAFRAMVQAKTLCPVPEELVDGEAIVQWATWNAMQPLGYSEPIDGPPVEANLEPVKIAQPEPPKPPPAPATLVVEVERSETQIGTCRFRRPAYGSTEFHLVLGDLSGLAADCDDWESFEEEVRAHITENAEIDCDRNEDDDSEFYDHFNVDDSTDTHTSIRSYTTFKEYLKDLMQTHLPEEYARLNDE